MNTNHLSVAEIMQYLSSGVITEMCAEEYEDRIVSAEVKCYKEGYKAPEPYFLDDVSL